jgi:hypothetical protein
MVTPWSQMHETVLQDGMSIFRRFGAYIILGGVRKGYFTLQEMVRKDFLPILLGLHNRRKTEEMMHNCRYIVVNSLGEYTSLIKLAEYFDGFNYTRFDAWLRTTILKRYPLFYEKMSNIRSLKKRLQEILEENEIEHLMFSDKLTYQYDIAEMIYCTYLMSKAPIDKAVEQALNANEILKDLETFLINHPDNKDLYPKS